MSRHQWKLIRFYSFFIVCMKKICCLRAQEIIQEWNKKKRIQKYVVGSSNIQPKVNRVVKKLVVCENIVQ